MWTATQPHVMALISQAGGVVHVEPVATWWADTPREEWPDDPLERIEIERRWDESFGDRRQEVAIIGIDMDEAAIVAQLDACLLDDDELASGPGAWRALADPFPAWRSACELEEEH